MRLALLVLVASIALLVGCESINPVTPQEGNNLATVGELKSNAATIADGKEIEVVKTLPTDGAPMAPSIVKQVKFRGTDLAIALSHEGAGDKGGEIVAIKTVDSDIHDGDKIRIYVDGKYIGKVWIAPGSSLSEVHILLEEEDLPESEGVIVEVEISRDGRVVADDEVKIKRTKITGITLEGVAIGDFPDEIVLTFSDTVNARSAVKDNISVVVDSARVGIRSYGENGDELTLIMRKDLGRGVYTISYNGEGGLRGLDGEEVGRFETALTVNAGTTAPAAKEVWRGIPHGVYKNGAHFLTALRLVCQNCKVSPWAEEILESAAFRVEESMGMTALYRLTAADLGLTGEYTGADVILEAVAQGYRLVPDETAAQLRMLYQDQPEGDLVVVLSSPLQREKGGTYLLAIGGGSNQFPGRHLIAVNTTATLGADYTAFIVTK